MRTPLALIAAMLCGIASGLAQTQEATALPMYYIYEGSRQSLEPDPFSIAVLVSAGATQEVLGSSAAGEGIRAVEPVPISGWYFIRLAASRPTPEDISTTIERLLKLPAVSFASPVFHGIGNTWVVMRPEILLRFRTEFVSQGKALLGDVAPDLEILTDNFGRLEGAFRLLSPERNGFRVLARANELAEDSRVAWAEPDVMFSGRSLHIPNDPGFSFLWGIRNTGQTGGVADMDMDGDRAWDILTGDAGVKVAIIDVGVQQDHPDLNQLPGGDMTGAGGGGGPMNACDHHGTAVAGCVSATIDNSLGTVGIAPGCKSLSIRTFEANIPCTGGWTTMVSWTVDALAWAESVGCKVSNNSNYYGFTSSSINDKYQSTYNNGMVHFASAGNNGVATISYPASIPVVNSVAALNDDGVRTSFSNYGTGLDFSAPGQDIYTTDRTGADGYVSGDYVYVWGTSFASPYAAGVAALVYSAFPSYTPAEVEARMRRGCKDLGASGYDTDYGWGFVNALRSVTTRVTFQVDMKVQMLAGEFRPDSGDVVTVQGGFNLWTNADTLRDPDADSIYARDVLIRPFLGYVYRFWKSLRGGMGLETADRVLSLDDPDTTLPAPYFNNDLPPSLPVFEVYPLSLGFGSVTVGDSAVLAVSVRNTGAGVLNISGATTDTAVYVPSPTSGTVVPGDSLEVTVTFKPAGAGSVGGALVFTHDAAGSPDTVILSGTGVSAGPSPKFLTITPETLLAKDPVRGKLLKAVKRPKPGKPIPYPNWSNLRDELVAQGGFAPGTSESDSAGGMRIGLSFMELRNPGNPLRPNWKPIKDSAKVHGWIRIGKYNFKKSVGASPTAIPKTLEKKTYRHTGPARGLDSTGNPGDVRRKLFLKEQKKLDPKKTSNKLFAEILALKFNIASSQLAKTPAGLGELIFDRDGHPLDELTVREIAARADTMITYWRGISQAEMDSLYGAIHDINRAFPGPLDTLSFMVGNVLTLAGLVELSSVPFLREPVPFVPLVRMPTTTETEPEEDFGEEEFEEEMDSGRPVAARLYSNYPNPFNPSTTISFRLREPSLVTIRVFTMLGQEVAVLLEGDELDEGYNEVEFQADGLSTGVYFFRMEIQGAGEVGIRSVQTGRMLLLK